MSLSGGGENLETPGEKVLEMIVRQCEPAQILEALCRQMGETEEEQQVAFFTLNGDTWTLAARGRLNPPSEEALARLSPENLSADLLGKNPSAKGVTAFDDGWAQHLYSGIGEMLGLLVGFRQPGDGGPDGQRAARIDAACRLAALAIEQRNLRDELTWQGDHDPVTGLYTQTFLDRTLAGEMQPGADEVALLHVNLDRFRQVNDVLGHALGNCILRMVGRRFCSLTGPGDLVARAGGDEFALLLRPGTVQRAAATADRVLESLSRTLSVDRHQVFVSASIGIGCSGPGSTPQSLQREAYVALYHAKQEGKCRWVRFDPSMAATPPERLEMEKCLRSALGRDEMLLYYQPQVDLSTGRVTGAEALLRWNPPGVGIISPSTFIPILEETGMIVEFGRRILRDACVQGKRWKEATGLSLRVGVNVSALQLRSPEFVGDVQAALAGSGYPADCLELELTESLFVGDYGPARAVLRQLRTLGVALALDDFGTGQSSLSYLQELPFQRLKVDQSFVRAIKGREHCPPVVENILTMARSLGMATIAEGIESPHQAAMLREAGCDEGQGFLYSVPLPAEEFLSFLNQPGAKGREGSWQ